MIYNISFDIAATVIAFFSIILALTKKVFEKRQNTILFALLVSAFFASLLDIFSSVGNSFLVVWSYGLRDVLNYGYLLVQNAMPYLFCLYIVSLTDLDQNMKQKRLLHVILAIPFIVDVALLCMNPFLREVFYYDENRVYTHDWGMIVLYVVAIIYLIINYYLMMKFGRKVRFVKKATVYVFLTASMGSVILQILFPTILLQLCIEVLCLSGILFTVENENEILHSVLMFFFLLAISIFAEVQVIPEIFPLRGMENFYFFILLVILMFYFVERIADRGKLRKYLLLCVGGMIMFILLRTAKYEAFIFQGTISRYLWYLYYLPVLFLPLFTFLASISIDEKNDKEYSSWGRISYIITIVLFLFVLSNDFHQLVFQFKPEFVNWDGDYSYGFLYYLVVVWNYLLYIFALIVMIQKCRVSTAKRLWWLTVIPFIIGITMLVLIATDNMLNINGLNIFEFPEVTCFMIALFWECCIRIGLIPTNKGYGELMGICSLAMQITDKNGIPVYKSATAINLTFMQKESSKPILLDENTMLHREGIPGGYSYWQDDISELNRINRELEEIQSRLSEETELIRLENELKEKQASIAQRTRIYDLIAKKTLPQSEQISRLAKQAIESMDTVVQIQCANRICVLGAYIKRYANLTLLAEKDFWMSSLELGMAMAESLRYLGNAGIPADYMGRVDEKLPSKVALLLYEIFEDILEMYIDQLQAVYVTMVKDRGIILKITFEGVAAMLDSDITKRLDDYGIESKVEQEDEVSFIRFLLEEGEVL